MAKQVVKTPLMRQYYNIKAKHPDAILLFRVGDFYETFEEDAVKTSKILVGSFLPFTVIKSSSRHKIVLSLSSSNVAEVIMIFVL